MNKEQSVVCLCWNCGREIFKDEDIHTINDELWCADCAGYSDNTETPVPNDLSLD